MMRWATPLPAAAAATAAFLYAASAHPQAAAPAAPAAQGSGLFNPSGGPIDISSDGAERFQTEGRSVYIGNVEVIQDQARLRTPRLTLFSTKRVAGAPKPQTAPNAGDDWGSIERIEAEGPVYYVTPTQQVKGDHGTYLAEPDTITVTGNVTLLQGQDVLHGDKLVLEQKTGHSTLTTDTPGKSPQRVRAVFFPKDKPPAKSGPAAAGAPPPTAPPGA